MDDLDNECYKVNTLNHEYGHTLQEQEMGFGKYFITVFAPSSLYNLMSRVSTTLHDNYYNMPWEYDADLRGGVDRDDTAEWAGVAHAIYWITIWMVSECLD